MTIANSGLKPTGFAIFSSNETNFKFVYNKVIWE